MIPGEARLVFNIRFNDLLDARDAQRRNRAPPRDGAAEGSFCELEFDPTNAVAFLTPRGDFTDLVARAIREVTGREPTLSTGGGTSDARFIKDACPVVEVGLDGRLDARRRRVRRCRRAGGADADL